MKILFMCVANSARSQIAESVAKSLFGSKVEVESAGSKPKYVNPFAVEVMKEVGIDLSKNQSKTVNELPKDFVQNLDYVITLCAEEVCPVLVSKAKKLHWPLTDPAGHSELEEEEQLNLFRITREAIKERLLAFKKELKI